MLKAEKKKDYWDAPSGVPGVETSLPLMLNAVNNDRLDLKEVCALMSENPARIFNLDGKGAVKEGYDADLVVIDMEKKRKIENKKLYTKCGWSPYDGRMLKGWPIMTFVKGKLAMENGKIFEDVKGEEVRVTK